MAPARLTVRPTDIGRVLDLLLTVSSETKARKTGVVPMIRTLALVFAAAVIAFAVGLPAVHTVTASAADRAAVLESL